MNNIKNILLIVVLTSLFTSITVVPVSANTSPNNSQKIATTTKTIVGTISAINNKLVTVNVRQPIQPIKIGTSTKNLLKTSPYTVNIANAIIASGANTKSNLVVGDMVMVQGTINGTTVSASVVRDIHISTSTVINKNRPITTQKNPIIPITKNKNIINTEKPKIIASSSSKITGSSTTQATTSSSSTPVTPKVEKQESKPGFFSRIGSFIVHLFGF